MSQHPFAYSFKHFELLNFSKYVFSVMIVKRHNIKVKSETSNGTDKKGLEKL
jgi:hypothetical protein